MSGPDPAGFSAAKVRDGLRLPMRMAQDASDPTVFVMTPAVSGSGVDDQGVPWEPNLIGVTPVSGAEIPAFCAIEYLVTGELNTPGVDSQPADILVSILDEDWGPVADCIGVKVSGVFYLKVRERPVVQLFTVAIHQVEFAAGDL